MSSEKEECIDCNDSQEMKFFLNEEECDISFKVENKIIVANKWLLRMKSNVFDAMFSSKFRESNDEIIEIVDMKYESFKTMIRYLYSNKLVLNEGWDGCQHTAAMDVYRCGHKYNLIELMRSTEEVLIKMITYDTIEDLYELARDYNLKKLRHRLDEFIQTNLDYYSHKSLDELKRISVLSECHLMSLLIAEKDNEINRLEKLVSELAKHCDRCRNRITFSPLNRI